MQAYAALHFCRFSAAGPVSLLVGETPLTYLTNWRSSQAKHLLATERISVSEVAAKVGYQSEAAFNQVFKGKTGRTPATYHRYRAASPAAGELTD